MTLSISQLIITFFRECEWVKNIVNKLCMKLIKTWIFVAH